VQTKAQNVRAREYGSSNVVHEATRGENGEQYRGRSALLNIGLSWSRGFGGVASRCLETANTGTLGDNSESIPNLVRYQPESVLYSKIYSSLAASRHLEAYQIGGFELSWPCKLSVSSGLEVMVSKQSRKAARPRGSHWARVYARALIHIAKNSHLDILFIF
jgi:hypothetical protein